MGAIASLTSPALEHVRIDVRVYSLLTLSTKDMDSRDASTDADRAQFAAHHRPSEASHSSPLVDVSDADGEVHNVREAVPSPLQVRIRYR